MVSKDRQEPIAIVGIGCRFPGAPNLDKFWKLLRDGMDAIREVPANRWDIDSFYDPDPDLPGKMTSKWGGFVENIDGFDWRAFRIPPREAKYMDPQQRLLLEVAWEALEDAGLPLEQAAGKNFGVFIALMWNDYLRLQSRDYSQLNAYATTGNAFSFAATRISYAFDLKGPSMAIDGACAGSLMSVHYACQSLWLGESNIALAGGVNLSLSPDVSIMLSKAGLLSSEGHCKTLDAQADGFVRGEGAGIVVLKPLSQTNSSDRVYAVIRGSAMNHNGHNEWIMASSQAGQEKALRDAYNRAGIDPVEVDYVELHGTGFKKGDAIETKVLGSVVGAQTGRESPCAIGSVKSNIGHLESAAGIASIIKVALSLHHHEIPPTIHLQEVNPDIPLEELGLSAQWELGRWPDRARPPIAGATAISLSGINAHIVLEGYQTNLVEHKRDDQDGSGTIQVLPISARSPEALKALAIAYRDKLIHGNGVHGPHLEDICYTASVGRSHHEHRLAVVGETVQTFVASLTAYLQGEQPAGVYSSQSPPEDRDVREELIDQVSESLLHQSQEGVVIPSLTVDDAEYGRMLEALSILYVRGYTIDWTNLHPLGGGIVQLPPYPWQRERLWLDWLEPQTPPAEEGVGLKFPQSLHREPPDILDKLANASALDRREIMLIYVRDQVKKVLGYEENHALDPQVGLFESGLNSLATVELTNNLQSGLERPLSPAMVFDYPTVEKLAEYLVEEIFNPVSNEVGDTEIVNKEKNTDYEDIKQLTEAEAEALLIGRLKEIRNE